jgi:hypothetical protein
MNKLIKFNDIESNNIIYFGYYEKICWIDWYSIDENKKTLFFHLLKNSFEKMKKKGFIKCQQLTFFNDWNTYLKKNLEWNIVKENNIDNTILLECDINLAFELVVDGILTKNN